MVFWGSLGPYGCSAAGQFASAWLCSRACARHNATRMLSWHDATARSARMSHDATARRCGGAEASRGRGTGRSWFARPDKAHRPDPYRIAKGLSGRLRIVAVPAGLGARGLVTVFAAVTWPLAVPGLAGCAAQGAGARRKGRGGRCRAASDPMWSGARRAAGQDRPGRLIPCGRPGMRAAVERLQVFMQELDGDGAFADG